LCIPIFLIPGVLPGFVQNYCQKDFKKKRFYAIFLKLIPF